MFWSREKWDESKKNKGKEKEKEKERLADKPLDFENNLSIRRSWGF